MEKILVEIVAFSIIGVIIFIIRWLFVDKIEDRKKGIGDYGIKQEEIDSYNKKKEAKK